MYTIIIHGAGPGYHRGVLDGREGRDRHPDPGGRVSGGGLEPRQEVLQEDPEDPGARGCGGLHHSMCFSK